MNHSFIHFCCCCWNSSVVSVQSKQAFFKFLFKGLVSVVKCRNLIETHLMIHSFTGSSDWSRCHSLSFQTSPSLQKDITLCVQISYYRVVNYVFSITRLKTVKPHSDWIHLFPSAFLYLMYFVKWAPRTW